jgi:hypothetical protein
LIVDRNLKNLEIAFNGIKLPQIALSFFAANNSVAVKGSQLEVNNVTITRPKPPNELKWFINICNMEIYASGWYLCVIFYDNKHSEYRFGYYC